MIRTPQLGSHAVHRREFVAGAALAAAAASRGTAQIPAKVAVLTFDDAVLAQRVNVAPLLRELGFRATFFVTHRWMNDPQFFLNWRQIAEIYSMGFEIGNHSWTHADFSVPRNAARLAGELALVENELRRVGVPRPTSFAWCGNGFGPEALAALGRLGFRFARRGLSPEIPYGQVAVGPAYDPARHHPLLVPTTGDAYPNWTFEHFQRVAAEARQGRITVLQFHGVPDVRHPWVNTDPELFRKCMHYLKDQGFRGIALGDLEQFVDPRRVPSDPMAGARYPQPKDGRLRLPVEMEATREDLPYWLGDMARHGYSEAEVAAVCGGPQGQARPASGRQPMLPYPGGRHPRLGFLDGAIDPLRGTKFSVFLPWDPASYVVVDLPEAIFSNLGLLFLAHTHVPTVWNDQNVVIDNVDWNRAADGSLRSEWTLPNQVAFGASARMEGEEVRMELWLRNGSREPLSKLRTQICLLLGRAQGFAAQTADNKILRQPTAGVRAPDGRRILIEWERCGRVWGNPACPCVHSDPVLPDCAPGESVRVAGRLWFEA
ncbi:MAG TPA: polysaccharide deacetylase family protein [Bryobacteraceae bacterium]|nr:polysaccharide deacetylase family protein [Bryobacteraceae bacterium]